MPVTKTAKRALRSSKRKVQINNTVFADMEIAIRKAKNSKRLSDVTVAFSKIDRAAKKKLIHKNKAARIKRKLSAMLPKTTKKAGVKSHTKK